MRDADARFQDANEMIDALAQSLAPLAIVPPPRPRRSAAVVLVPTLVVAIGLAGLAIAGDREELAAPPVIEPANYNVDVSAEPETAELWLDGKLVATGHLSTSQPRDGASHELSVKAPGYAPVTIFFADAAPPALVRLERLPAARTQADDALSAAVRGALTTSAKGAPAPAAAAPAPGRPAVRGKSNPRGRNEPRVKVIGGDEPVVRVLD
jgi:hypothetical protein